MNNRKTTKCLTCGEFFPFVPYTDFKVPYKCVKCELKVKNKLKNDYTNTKKLKLAFQSYLSEKKRLPKNNVRLIWYKLENKYSLSIFFSDSSINNLLIADIIL